MKQCISVLLHNTFVCRVEDLSLALCAVHEGQRRKICILALSREKIFQPSCTSVRPSTHNSVISTSVRATRQSLSPYWTDRPCSDQLHLLPCFQCKNVLHVLPVLKAGDVLKFRLISQKRFANIAYTHIANNDSTVLHEGLMLVNCR